MPVSRKPKTAKKKRQKRGKAGESGRGVAGVTVADVCQSLDTLAPFALAQAWDNVGLLAGTPEWNAARVLLAIDLTDAVAEEALKKDVDVVVAYHPPIFKGVRSVSPAADGPTSRLAELLAAKISIVSLHTALDAAVGGTNDVLLDVFQPVARYPLEVRPESGRDLKLVAFVPEAEVSTLRRTLSDAGAGVIGAYSECSYELRGQGTFKGDETTNPTVGERERLETADEIRLEMVVPRPRLGEVVRAIYDTHSYEEPAFDLYPLESVTSRGQTGMGRVGVLDRPRKGADLVERLRGHVDLASATVVGDLKRRFRTVTAAAGAFGVSAFRDPHSLVLTGEFKHHDALQLRRRDVTALHLGHYASERPVLDVIRRQLRTLRGAKVEIAKADTAPLRPL